MAANTLAGLGLVFSRNRRTNAPTFQANQYTIKSGYATKIGLGDMVATGTAGNQGYVILAADGSTTQLGVFAGVLPYFDLTLQASSYGLNGSYPASANPSADIPCLVIDDPDAVFRVQVSGGPWAQSWRGQNIGWTATTNGAPNLSGISTLTLSAASINTTATLPFRILGLAGIGGGPQDPANTNPWIEVVMNTAENLSSTGI